MAKKTDTPLNEEVPAIDDKTLVGKNVHYVLEGGCHPGEVREAHLLTEPMGDFQRSDLSVTTLPEDFPGQGSNTQLIRENVPRDENVKVPGSWHVTD